MLSWDSFKLDSLEITRSVEYEDMESICKFVRKGKRLFKYFRAQTLWFGVQLRMTIKNSNTKNLFSDAVSMS